ncbi:hypothetical protein PG993_014336 [Apiospora rasikravindrae]|uniref:Uncharacterized protein n=1 Tax=Apiospora rasikravindrae TaxID=990691 RepID=A0ABR1RMX4_9PEZI
MCASVTFWLTLSLFALGFLAQDVGFDLDGAIDAATTADDTLFNSGGTISVNGFAVTVPKNIQVGFPASWVPWRDFVTAWKDGKFPGFEVSVVGNFVNGGGPIAAQVYVSSLFTQGSSGFISQVNFDGTMKIANGPTIRINDPNAVYSSGYTESPFMTADDQNPSISSFSGFPMCVPRSANDPLCPASNRPVISGTSNRQGTLRAPDPLVMAPFVVGDWIEYSGYRNSAGQIVCYSIVASNIQITTGGSPTYIRMEDANIGVFTTDTNAEAGQTKFVGYTSDAAGSPVNIQAIDIDVCTGEPTYRNVVTGAVDATQPRNKFDQRLRAQPGDRYTREYRIVASSPTKLTKNNITAGQYIQPVTEWIQPELTSPGIAPVAHDFSGFGHLTNGLGRDANGDIWGPLDPFPQSNVKVFDVSSCPKSPPASPTTSTTTSPPATSTTTTPKDTVRVTAAAWASSNGGTLTVTCVSSNTNANQVGMVLDYVQNGINVSNLAMTASTSTPGSWDFSGRSIKKTVTSVTCRSKLGGSAVATPTQKKRKRRHLATAAFEED